MHPPSSFAHFISFGVGPITGVHCSINYIANNPVNLLDNRVIWKMRGHFEKIGLLYLCLLSGSKEGRAFAIHFRLATEEQSVISFQRWYLEGLVNYISQLNVGDYGNIGSNSKFFLDNFEKCLLPAFISTLVSVPEISPTPSRH